MLFSTSVQPSIISLFSSTGSDPLTLFRTSVDKSLPSDSFIHFLHDQYSNPPPPPGSLLHLPNISEQDNSPSYGYELDQTVLHIQSPTIQTTYIQCPKTHESRDGSSKSNALGFKHPWMHLQVRNLGREWAFEVGIVDQAGRVGIVRLSTFQKRPRLKLNHQKSGSPPLLLLPLSFPSHSAYPLTPWNTINIHLPSFLPYFSSPILHSSDDNDNDHDDRERDPTQEMKSRSSNSTRTTSLTVIPGGTYSHVSYVRVYASCRLRRIWFGEGDARQKIPWEFELYSV